MLRTVCPALPGNYSHWVLASQTCNLFNCDFEKIPSVEWVGAREIKAEEVTNTLKNGLNPRRLHCHAGVSAGARRFFSCDIYARFWHDRKLLADITSDKLALKDENNAAQEDRQKDVFIGWLARSYTRIELSNELGKALKNGGVDKAITTLLKAHAKDIYGIFLNIAERAPDSANGVDDEDDEEETLPSPWKNPVVIDPPAIVDITIVVRDASLVKSVLNLAKIEFTKQVDDPIRPESGRTQKIPRTKLAERHGIYMTIDDNVVKTVSDWTAKDILRTVRYSLFDSLSDPNETDGV